jgi:hypothetical protein
MSDRQPDSAIAPDPRDELLASVDDPLVKRWLARLLATEPEAQAEPTGTAGKPEK